VIKKIASLFTLALLSTLSAFAQHTKTGPHGTTATGSASRSGNTVSGNGSVTGARGNQVSGQGSVSRTRTGTSESGSVTGPKGGTTTVSGNTTNNGNGTTTVTGAVTRPRGKSKSGSTTVPN
jgi:hypothetical protein